MREGLPPSSPLRFDDSDDGRSQAQADGEPNSEDERDDNNAYNNSNSAQDLAKRQDDSHDEYDSNDNNDDHEADNKADDKADDTDNDRDNTNTNPPHARRALTAAATTATTTKRPRSGSYDADDELVPTKKINRDAAPTRDNRPRRSDFGDDKKSFIWLACDLMKAYIVARSAYPDRLVEGELITAAWVDACERMGSSYSLASAASSLVSALYKIFFLLTHTLTSPPAFSPGLPSAERIS